MYVIKYCTQISGPETRLIRGAVKFKPEYAHCSSRGTVSKILHKIIIKQSHIFKKFAFKEFFSNKAPANFILSDTAYNCLTCPKLQIYFFTFLLITFTGAKQLVQMFRSMYFTTCKTTTCFMASKNLGIF